MGQGSKGKVLGGGTGMIGEVPSCDLELDGWTRGYSADCCTRSLLESGGDATPERWRSSSPGVLELGLHDGSVLVFVFMCIDSSFIVVRCGLCSGVTGDGKGINRCVEFFMQLIQITSVTLRTGH